MKRTSLIIGALICAAFSSLFADKVSLSDILYKVGPRYPVKERRAKIGGTGRYRMLIDFKTGKVNEVVIVQSAGSDGLDREAIFALRRWRFKPGKVRQVDLPITFANGKEPVVLPPGSKILPGQ
jgi:TonB family protein